MMATIEFNRPHTLSRTAARRAVTSIAEDLAQRLQVSYEWHEDTLRFNRTGAEGRIDLLDDAVHVEVDLAMSLSPMRGVIEEQIRTYLDQRMNGEK